MSNKEQTFKTGQKIIKYTTIFLALLLIITIFLNLITFLGLLDNKKEEVAYNNELKFANLIDINYLDIDVKTTNINVKIGEQFSIKTNNNYVSLKQELNKIIIKEKDNIKLNKKSSIEIVLPSSILFEKVEIETDASLIDIESLNTKKLELDLGAGNVTFATLNVFEEAKINGGAGQFLINNGSLNNLDLDAGIGNIIIKTTLNGSSVLDLGIGNCSLELKNKLDDLTIFLDKGIGSFKVNNEKIKSEQTIGNGNTYLKVDGGIGTFTVTTKSN